MPNYLSAADFLKGIVGKEEEVEVTGVGTVRIRPLTVLETQSMYEQTKNSAERMVIAVANALVEPKLSEAQAKELMHGSAGRMMPLINRVMVLSGMIEEDVIDPLAGSGS